MEEKKVVFDLEELKDLEWVYSGLGYDEAFSTVDNDVLIELKLSTISDTYNYKLMIEGKEQHIDYDTLSLLFRFLEKIREQQKEKKYLRDKKTFVKDKLKK